MQVMPDENKKMIYPALMELWKQQIDSRIDSQNKESHARFFKTRFLEHISSLDETMLGCFENAPEHVEPFREEFNDIISTFSRASRNDNFVTRFKKLLASTAAEVEKLPPAKATTPNDGYGSNG